MRIVGDVDCNTCAYLASHYCNSCYHNDDFKDNYEEASPEELKQRRRSKQQKMEEALCDQLVKLQLPQEFTEVFSSAKSILDGCLYPEYLTLYAGEVAGKEGILSCNGYVLCHLFCDIPEQLKGKKMVYPVECGVYITNSTDTLWDKCMNGILSLLDRPQQEHLYDPSKVKIKGENAFLSFLDLDGSLKIKAKHLESVVSVLGHGLLMGVSIKPEDYNPYYLVFEGPMGRAVISTTKVTKREQPCSG
jgi:hypothetical protein